MSKIKFKPFEDRVLVRPLKQDSKLSSGLIIPGNASEKPQKGVVVAVGEGLSGKPNTVKINDTVLYGKETGLAIDLDGERFLIMRNLDVYGVIEE